MEELREFPIFFNIFDYFENSGNELINLCLYFKSKLVYDIIPYYEYLFNNRYITILSQLSTLSYLFLESFHISKWSLHKLIGFHQKKESLEWSAFIGCQLNVLLKIITIVLQPRVQMTLVGTDICVSFHLFALLRFIFCLFNFHLECTL